VCLVRVMCVLCVCLVCSMYCVCIGMYTYTLVLYVTPFIFFTNVQFYGIMMGVYIIYALVWTILMGLSYKDLIQLQVCGVHSICIYTCTCVHV